MNIRNTAFLTLALLVIAAPAFASATKKDNKPAADKPGITAQALELGKAGLKKVTDHPYVSGAVAATVVAGTAAVVAYKKSPAFKAKADEAAAAVKTRTQATYKAVCAKLSLLSEKKFTRADAAIGATGVAAVVGLYKYSDEIKAGAKSAKDSVASKLSDAYAYCATSKAVVAVKDASNTAKAAAVAVTALVGFGIYKAYDMYKNRKKAAPVVTPAVPATVAVANAQ